MWSRSDLYFLFQYSWRYYVSIEMVVSILLFYGWDSIVVVVMENVFMSGRSLFFPSKCWLAAGFSVVVDSLASCVHTLIVFFSSLGQPRRPLFLEEASQPPTVWSSLEDYTQNQHFSLTERRLCVCYISAQYHCSLCRWWPRRPPSHLAGRPRFEAEYGRIYLFLLKPLIQRTFHSRLH